MAYGPRLTQLRERRGWSRAQLAESSGLSVDTIEQIERDQLSPGLVELRKLASALDLLLSELFEDKPTSCASSCVHSTRRPGAADPE